MWSKNIGGIYKIMNLKITSKLVVDSEDESTVLLVHFSAEDCEFATITVENPASISSADYSKIQEGDHVLTFIQCDDNHCHKEHNDDENCEEKHCNNIGEISRKDGMVSFIFGKMGSGRIELYVPTVFCESMFSALVDWKKQHE